MNITGFQTSTNLAQGSFKLLKITAGQTATIHFTVTNNYNGKYALNLNSLRTAGLHDTNHHLAFAPDPTWTNYFPGTLTNFFMAGPSAKVPAVWTFNLAVKTNTPPDLYLLKSQMAGYDSNHRKWSQQEEFCLQVIAREQVIWIPGAELPVLRSVSYVPFKMKRSFYLLAAALIISTVLAQDISLPAP